MTSRAVDVAALGRLSQRPDVRRPLVWGQRRADISALRSFWFTKIMYYCDV